MYRSKASVKVKLKRHTLFFSLYIHIVVKKSVESVVGVKWEIARFGFDPTVEIK